jgi:fatty acid-binding protein DegV
LARLDFADVIVAEIGPVIGSHVGPGMLAVVFSGTER